MIASCAIAAACSRPLSDSADSPEQLAAAVLEALASRDRDALLRLAVDETEFRGEVWPELPASRPERNLPFGYVWTDLKTKSDAGLDRVLAEHGGLRYQLQQLRFNRPSTKYDSFLIHREAMVDVRAPDGTALTLQLFGSVIQKGGRFKVFSYVVD